MLLIDLLPLVVGAAVLPLWIITALLLLRSEGGVLKAAAFAAGAMTVRVSQGILFGYVFDTADDASGDRSKFITSTLLVVVGILLSIAAFRTWRKEANPNAPPPKWMATLSGLPSPKAFGIGLYAAIKLFNVGTCIHQKSSLEVGFIVRFFGERNP